MLSERILSRVVRMMNGHYLNIEPIALEHAILPAPKPSLKYMLYMHVPFCERLCPYCSFNRFPYDEQKAERYFKNLRAEMQMVAKLGYDFESLYIGGGTPTINASELLKTIDCARDTFSIKEVSCETNPNHLTKEMVNLFAGKIQRLSVGVQSFDDGLLKQMDRYEKYGSAQKIASQVQEVADSKAFTSLNVDMIFNFPAQNEQMLRHDLDVIKQTHANQTTFYPLMASPAVEKSLALTVGKVDYSREQRFYEIICQELTGQGCVGQSYGARGVDSLAEQDSDGQSCAVQGVNAQSSATQPAQESTSAPFVFGDAWTFNSSKDAMIDEYIVDYEEYPAIGSGGMSFLDEKLHINTFSINEYNQAIEAGHMSVMGATKFSKKDHMRYRFMMSLFGLRLDKKRWQKDFGCSVASGLRAEYEFFKLSGAIDNETEEEITLTPKGRYMMVAMMRQFFIGVNGVRDKARSNLPEDERELLFGAGVPLKQD